MKTVAFIAAVLALGLPMTASAKPRNSIFTLVVNSEHFDAGKTYTGNGFGLAQGDIQVSPTSVILLDGDVPRDIVRKTGAGKHTTLATGSLLYSAGSEQVMYCAKDDNGDFFSATTTPCLLDSDGDGSFDQAVKSKQDMMTPGALVFNDNANMGSHFIGNRLSPVIALPAPVPYHRDTAPAPRISADIMYLSDYRKDHPGPVHFTFVIRVANVYNVGSLFAQPTTITFDGAPVSADLFGIKLTVVGLDKYGEPICHLEGGLDNVTLPFLMQNMKAASINIY